MNGYARAHCEQLDCVRSGAKRKAAESGVSRERNWQFGDQIKLAASLFFLLSQVLAQIGKSAIGELSFALSFSLFIEAEAEAK